MSGKGRSGQRDTETELRAEAEKLSDLQKRLEPFHRSRNDLSDSGLPRIELEVLRDAPTTQFERVPRGTRGLFVHYPEGQWMGVETVQLRLGNRTVEIPAACVRAVGPPGHAERFNEMHERMVGSSRLSDDDLLKLVRQCRREIETKGDRDATV